MRADLDHLPLAKRHELEAVVSTLFEEFEDALGAQRAASQGRRILTIVLFGSCARGA
jgi:hypothetical protein